jgi:nitroimidazol reductase NimA-like FMN-containing flavoprotein (pyridoxamine 5'-phosphate oxidase superfamily)
MSQVTEGGGPLTSGPSAHSLRRPSTHAYAMSEPAVLTYDQCRELLETKVVGRAAVCTPTGPRIFPVNYAVVDEAIVFRTTAYSVLGTYAWNTQLAFEVDDIDESARVGWSVVALGRGAMVEDSTELAEIRSAADPTPWAGGMRYLYVRLRWSELTGRQIGNF